MVNILIDNNGIDTICENLDWFLSIKDKVNFFINATVLEELANMGEIKKKILLENKVKIFFKK